MEDNITLAIYRKRKTELLTSRHAFSKYMVVEDYNYYKDIMSEEEFLNAKRESKRRYAKRKRCNDKLKELIKTYLDYEGKYKLLFGCCTFNNKEIGFKERTRAKKVNKWLMEHFDACLVNIDYGDKNDREHYHFVGLTTEDIEGVGKRGNSGYKMFELVKKDYPLGWEPDLEIININSEDYNLKKISNYLVKINYHSNKKSSSKRRIRYFNKLVS